MIVYSKALPTFSQCNINIQCHLMPKKYCFNVFLVTVWRKKKTLPVTPVNENFWLTQTSF